MENKNNKIFLAGMWRLDVSGSGKGPVVSPCEDGNELTLREEHRLRGFENRVLRKIFGTKREEDGSWRKLHNGILHRLLLK
jgi:hypothetical protein